MTERKDERWLDEQLQRTINGSTPRFNVESWKRKHRQEYQVLLSRAGRESRRLWQSKSRPAMIGGLAVAAAIAVAVGLFVLGRNGRGPGPLPEPTVKSQAQQMMSMMSLRMAYRRGGLDALDRQLQDTLNEFGPRSSSVPIQELYNM
ncbi:MAG: hypothetical protein JW955_02205 [Sedimentisphaerales bacterium]|nr:hypothetical protein [Sedimentisphaerales bacterium]